MPGESATGHFSNDGIGAFTDQYTFQLVGSSFVAFASATNDYVSASDFITNFTGQLFLQVGAVAGDGNDIPVNAPAAAVGCPGNPGGCQILAGVALLDAGNYFLQLSGTGGSTAGYGGNLTVQEAIPEPATWAMILFGFAGIGLMAAHRRQRLRLT